jgi:hypothetical protein
MDKKYIIYASDGMPENDISISCADIDDMMNYAKAVLLNGYSEVSLVISD